MLYVAPRQHGFKNETLNGWFLSIFFNLIFFSAPIFFWLPFLCTLILHYFTNREDMLTVKVVFHMVNGQFTTVTYEENILWLYVTKAFEEKHGLVMSEVRYHLSVCQQDGKFEVCESVPCNWTLKRIVQNGKGFNEKSSLMVTVLLSPQKQNIGSQLLCDGVSPRDLLTYIKRGTEGEKAISDIELQPCVC